MPLLATNWWRPLLKKHEKRYLLCCPNCETCGTVFRDNLYWRRDIFNPKKRVFRCGICFTQLIWNGSRWIVKED